jgi:hypothetical protein
LVLKARQHCVDVEGATAPVEGEIFTAEEISTAEEENEEGLGKTESMATVLYNRSVWSSGTV